LEDFIKASNEEHEKRRKENLKMNHDNLSCITEQSEEETNEDFLNQPLGKKHSRKSSKGEKEIN
jgi:hypothetical protein